MPDVAELRVKVGASVGEAQAGLSQVESQLKGVAKSGKNMGADIEAGSKQGGAGVLTFRQNLALMTAGVGEAIKIIGYLKDGFEKLYQTAKEGAELEYMRERFDRLSTAIGTTSDALMIKLREATKGTQSDAQIVEGAGKIMALGLAQTEDEVVRLTTVASALGMNWDQLTLTLTNKTMMRFDQLGVSTDGFKERLKALEAQGYSTDDAFKEAFLQQAEAQLAKIGNQADADIGDFKRLEAEIGNFGNRVKTEIGDIAQPLVKGLSETLHTINLNADLNNQFIELKNSIKDAGISTKEFEKAWRQATDPHTGLLNLQEANRTIAAMIIIEKDLEDGTYDLKNAVEQLGIGALTVGQSTQDWAEAHYDLSMSYDDLIAQTEEAIIATDGLTAAEREQIDTITSLTTNFKDIINYAKEYDKNQEEIAAKEAERQELLNKGYSETSKKVKELDADIATMKENALANMTELANQMTLNMLMATISIDGVTESEAAAYFKMAADMGLISKEAAQTAMDAYGNAVDTINNYVLEDKKAKVIIAKEDAIKALDDVQKCSIEDKEAKADVDNEPAMNSLFDINNYNLEDKSFEITADRKKAEDTLNFIKNFVLPEKEQRIRITTYGGENIPLTQAVGGSVYPNENYLWQEPGREGELFVPSTYGRVFSENELAQIFREAFGRNGSQSGTQNISNVVNNYYSLTMPTSNRPEEVMTAFELLKGYGEAL